MAFQPINFASIAPLGNEALRNLLPDIMRGYQASQLPGQMARQKEQEELQNAFKRLQLEEEPQRFRASMQAQALANALNQARIEQLKRQANLPFGGKIAPGAVGQTMWLDMIRQQYGEDSPQYQSAKEAHEAEIASVTATRERNQALANSIAFRGLPADEKTRVISTAVGLGYDPTEAAQRLASGATLEQLADEKGSQLSEAQPVYPLSGETRKQLNNRRAFVNEIASLEKNTSEPLSKIGRRVFGYSPTQIWDAIQDKNPDEQGKILAARALQPELASLRMRAAGGQVGIEAIREMQHSAMGNLSVFEPLVSGKAREAMNKYISQWIDEAVQTYNDSIESSAQLGRGGRRRGTPETTRKIGNKTYVKIDGEWFEK